MPGTGLDPFDLEPGKIRAGFFDGGAEGRQVVSPHLIL